MSEHAVWPLRCTPPHTFRSVLNIGLRGPISDSFWAPKYIIIQVFSHLFKIISIGFTSFLFYMLNGGTFMCISMMCPKGSIYGPGVKVAAELVRPPGLLFYFLGLCLSPTVWNNRWIFMKFQDMDTSSNWLDCFMPDYTVLRSSITRHAGGLCSPSASCYLYSDLHLLQTVIIQLTEIYDLNGRHSRHANHHSPQHVGGLSCTLSVWLQCTVYSDGVTWMDNQQSACCQNQVLYLARNQLPHQVPSWVKIPGIDHLIPED